MPISLFLSLTWLRVICFVYRAGLCNACLHQTVFWNGQKIYVFLTLFSIFCCMISSGITDFTSNCAICFILVVFVFWENYCAPTSHHIIKRVTGFSCLFYFIIFFFLLLVLLRRTSFLTTIYGLYFFHLTHTQLQISWWSEGHVCHQFLQYWTQL